MIKPWIVLLALALTACGNSAATTSGDVRLPDARLMTAPRRLPDLPTEARGNSPMWTAYGQCRLEYADVGDRHLGLIAYTKAVRGKF